MPAALPVGSGAAARELLPADGRRQRSGRRLLRRLRRQRRLLARRRRRLRKGSRGRRPDGVPAPHDGRLRARGRRAPRACSRASTRRCSSTTSRAASRPRYSRTSASAAAAWTLTLAAAGHPAALVVTCGRRRPRSSAISGTLLGVFPDPTHHRVDHDPAPRRRARALHRRARRGAGARAGAQRRADDRAARRHAAARRRARRSTRCSRSSTCERGARDDIAILAAHVSA